MDNFWLNLAQINLFLQHLGSWLFTPMRFFSFLGDEEFYLVVMPAIYWCYDSSIGLRVGLLLMLSNSVNGFFKFLFHSPRPFWITGQVNPMVSESSFGVPSGHAQNAASIWGYFAILSKKTWIRVVFILIIFLIGLSRLYLGVHFIVDVLAGWLLGGLVLWLFTKYFGKTKSIVIKWTPGKQWAGAIVSSGLMILFPAILKIIYQNWQYKPEYLENIKIHLPELETTPFSMDGVISAAAVWFGILAGLILVQHIIPLGRVKASIEQLFTRFIIGTIGVLVIWMGLKLIFPDDIAFVSEILRFIRYGLLGIWVSAGAPYIFLKVGLQTKIKQNNRRR
ncbi:MAG: phosphatase PAP2 family protein [Anaerolineaceae bacterium]